MVGSFLRAAAIAGTMVGCMAGEALAAGDTCADYAAPTLIGTALLGPVSVPIDLVPGDRLTLRFDYATSRDSTGRTIIELTGLTPSFTHEEILGSQDSGSVTITGQALTAGASSLTFQVDQPDATDSMDQADGYLSCEHVATTGGTGSIADALTRQNAVQATRMIDALVDGGIEAAYGAQPGPSAVMGYAGTVVLDATPDDLRGSGLSLWTGLNYTLMPGTADQWAGGQVAGAAGVNFALDDAWVVGAFGAYDQSGLTLQASDQSFDAAGWSLGALTSYRLGAWRLDLKGYGSVVGYALDDAGTTASFSGLRYAVSGEVTGALPISANFDFAPLAGIAVLGERQAAYTDSAATAHAAQESLAARGTAGGKLVFYPDAGSFSLSAGAYADYWSDGGLAGRVQAGGKLDLGESGSVGVDAGLGNVGGEQLTGSVSASLGGGF